MLSKRMISKEDESESSFTDAEVTREDQDRINRFSRLHQRERGLIEEVALKQKDKEDIEEISLELELADEDELIPYRISPQTLFHLPLPRAQKLLAQRSDAVDVEIADLETRLDGLREEMKELKVKLYARFGRGINLEG